MKSTQRSKNVAKHKDRESKSLEITKYPAWVKFVPVFLLVICLFWWLFYRSGTISGQVLDLSSHHVLRGVEVVLDDAETQVVSGLTGAFVFTNIKPGSHTLKVRQEGFVGQQQTLQLKAGQLHSLQFLLQAQSKKVLQTDQLLIVGLNGQNSLLIMDKHYKLLKKIGLQGNPSAAVAFGDLLYVAEKNLSQIALIDLTTLEVKQRIHLPKFSEPIQLLLTQDQKNIFVLNSVRKTISKISTSTNRLAESELSLAVSPRNMMQIDDGVVWVLGANSLQGVYASSFSMGATVDLPGIRSDQMDYDVSSRRFVILNKNELVLVDPYNTSLDHVNLGYPLKSFYSLGKGRLMAIREQDVTIFDIVQGQYQGPKYPYSGEYVAHTDFAGDHVIASTNPNNLTVFNLKEEVLKQKISISGKASFLFSYVMQK